MKLNPSIKNMSNEYIFFTDQTALTFRICLVHIHIDVNHICSASSMNMSIFMTSVILSFTSNQVQATVISGVPVEVH